MSSANELVAEDGKFKSYSSIENHYLQSFLDNIFASAEYDPKEKWVASEKIHGSNFSFIMTEQKETASIKVTVAKRTGIVEEGDKGFFPNALPSVKQRYQAAHTKLFSKLKQLLGLAPFENNDNSSSLLSKLLFPNDTIYALKQVVLFGELFGGHYPGTKRDESLMGHPIQKGVYYCPHFDFYAFDTYILCEKKDTGKKPQSPSSLEENNSQQQDQVSAAQDEEKRTTFGFWLPHDLNIELWPSCGYTIYAKPIATGTLKDLLQINVEVPSTIPKAFFAHLEPATPEAYDNIMEGIVIKPLHRNFTVKSARVIVKKKSERFAEVTKGPPKNRQPKLKPEIDEPNFVKKEDSAEALEIMKRYMTVPRIEGCESKIGEVNYKNMGDLIKLFVKDIFNDFEKENESLWGRVPEHDRKIIHKKISGSAPEMVKQWLKENNKF